MRIKSKEGSITIEAAISLIVMISAVLMISMFIRVVHVHGVIQHALIQTAGEIASYSYILSMTEINTLNTQMRNHADASSATVSEAITEAEDFLGQIGQGNLDANMPEWNAARLKSTLNDLGRAAAGEAYDYAMRTALNELITIPLFKTYLPDDSQDFFDKNRVVSTTRFPVNFGYSSYFAGERGDMIELVAAYNMKFISPIPIIDEFTIVQTAKTRAWFSNGNPAPDSVWDLANFPRSAAIIEGDPRYNLRSNFSGIRGFEDGDAYTYTTIDLNAKSYDADRAKTLSKIKEKINDVKNFTSDTNYGDEIKAGDIERVIYNVYVPQNTSEGNKDMIDSIRSELSGTIILSDGREVPLEINIIPIE